MVRPRQIHTSKSKKEQLEYMRTVIRKSFEPTIEDTSPIIDTTDHSEVSEEKPNLPFKPTKQPSLLKNILANNTTEIVMSIVSFLLFPFLIWGGSQIYNLNREIGEVLTAIENDKSTIIHLQSQADKVERRMAEQIVTIYSDMDRLENRVDQLIDRRVK